MDKRLLNARGLPNFGINFYIINKKGEYSGVGMYNAGGGATYAVCDEKGARLEKIEPLLEGKPEDL